MLEFAITLPVFILFVFGIVDLGQASYQYGELNNAVREGARVATYDQNETNIKNSVIAKAPTLGLTTGNITVTCYTGFTATTKTCSTVTIGDGVKVAGSKSFAPITGQIAAAVGSSVTLSAWAMRSVQ